MDCNDLLNSTNQTISSNTFCFPYLNINNSFNQNSITNANNIINNKLPSDEIQRPPVLQDLYNLYSNNNNPEAQITFEDTENFKNILYNASHSILDNKINTWNEFVRKCILNIMVQDIFQKYIKKNLYNLFITNFYNSASNFISDDIINHNSVGRFGVISNVNNQTVSIYDYLKYDDKQKLGKIKYENMNTIDGLENLQDYNKFKTIIDSIHNNCLKSKIQNNSLTDCDSNSAVVLLNNIVRPIYYFFLTQAIYNFMLDFLKHPTYYSVTMNIPQPEGFFNENYSKIQLKIQYNACHQNKNVLVLTFDCSPQNKSYEITAFYNEQCNNTNNFNFKRPKSKNSKNFFWD